MESTTCPYCQHRRKRNGRDQLGHQRYKCLSPTCGRTSAERPPAGLFGSFRVPEDKALLCLGLLADGASVRALERSLNIHRDTILRL